ncbi:MAG TPA: MBL fold metallo-hydrolase, partial [Bacteroidia bacterium]|nr:MBL fold metallo-hydrolase [Bacteroidia bacterium]
MKNIFIRVIVSALLLSGLSVNGQTTSDSTKTTPKKYQAKATATQPFGVKAFSKSKKTTLRWLGMAGFLINSRGTTFMVDPLLEGFDMPMMIDFPILAKNVPQLDAVFVTHADNDHFSVPTNVAMSKVTDVYHTTVYVDSLMKNLSLKSIGHIIG